MSLIPVQEGEIQVGSPLAWSIFDQDGQLLMMEGETVATEDQLLLLMDHCPLRTLVWEEGEPETLPGEPEKESKAPGEEAFLFADMRLKVGDRLQIQPKTGIDFRLRLYEGSIDFLSGLPVIIQLVHQCFAQPGVQIIGINLFRCFKIGFGFRSVVLFEEQQSSPVISLHIVGITTDDGIVIFHGFNKPLHVTQQGGPVMKHQIRHGIVGHRCREGNIGIVEQPQLTL